MIVGGIYAITNLINGKCYIGSAINLKRRKNQHFRLLKNDKHNNKHLQNAWNKYGVDNFEFLVIEEVQDKEMLIKREQLYIDSLTPEYNICPNAGSSLGKKLSAEHKQKLSNAHKGKQTGKDHPMFGKHLSEETKQKISENRKGKCIGENHFMFKKHLSAETKQKLSEALKGENSPNFGKHLNDKEKQKLSELKKGEKNYNSQLTWQQVKEIREKYIPKIYSQFRLAKEYSISRSTIQQIIENRIWKESD